MGCNDNSDNITCDLTGYPAQGDYTTWENLVNEVSGVGATLVGKPYNVYRITSTSNGDFIQPANLVFSIFIEREKDSSSDPGRETLGQGVFWYSLVGDLSLCLVGDVFVQDDPFFGVGHTIITGPTQQFVGLGLSEYDALKLPTAGRLDRNVRVYRPPLGPNSDLQWDNTVPSASALVCTAGAFGLVPYTSSPVASYVPMGFQLDKKARGNIIVDVPDVPPVTRWQAYVPPLPGFTFREGDIIVNQEGDRYRVENPYRQDTGVVGSQLTLCRYVGQP